MEIVVVLNIVIALGLGIYVLLIVLEVVAVMNKKNFFQKEKFMVLSVRVAKDNEAGPLVAEQIFATLHGIVNNISYVDRVKGVSQDKISFEIANISRSIKFYVHFPVRLRTLVEGQIYAQYPNVEIEEVNDYAMPQNMEVGKVTQTGEGRDITLLDQPKVASVAGDFKLVNEFLTAVGAELILQSTDFYPIKSFNKFEDKSTKMNVDPLAGITATLAKFNDPDEQAWIQFVTSPIPEKRRKLYMNCLNALQSGGLFNNPHFRNWYFKFFCQGSRLKRIIFFPIYILLKPRAQKSVVSALGAVEPPKNPALEDAVDKLSKLLFRVQIRIVYVPKEKNDVVAMVKIREIAGSFKQFNLSNLNGFAMGRIYNDSSVVDVYRERVLEEGNILNIEELATIFHLPNITVQTPNIYWVRSKKVEPPNDLPKAVPENAAEVTALGKTNYRGVNLDFGIKTLDRRRHMYIIGKTGMGKSTLLENMIFNDIQAGKGLAIIDPHGDLAEAVINFIPARRTNDVIIFDPSDRDFPIAFNMLENVDPALNTIICSGLVGIFKKIYADSWGPRLEHILRNTILSLLEYPNTTLLGIPRVLQDYEFRKRVIRKVTDPLVKSFWVNEFEKMEPKMRVEAISPILNKVGQFLSSPIIRNILGQVKSLIDFRFAMDHKKIVIVNLSKGKIGEDNSSLLGSMLITKFQIDAMSRANVPEKDRTDFYLYVDEFQNFATDSFATILSEARKYRLNLTMANQYIAQMPEEVRDAVFGNVGTILSYQVGFDDAEYLSGQYGEEVLPNDLVGLSKYTAYMRLLIDGMPSKTFSLDTLPPPVWEAEEGRREKVIRLSREKYANPREVVEDKIMRWSKGFDIDEDESILAEPQKKKALPTAAKIALPSPQNSPLQVLSQKPLPVKKEVPKK